MTLPMLVVPASIGHACERQDHVLCCHLLWHEQANLHRDKKAEASFQSAANLSSYQTIDLRQLHAPERH